MVTVEESLADLWFICVVSEETDGAERIESPLETRHFDLSPAFLSALSPDFRIVDR